MSKQTDEHFRQVRWENVWVSIPGSGYVRTPREAEALAERLERVAEECRRIAKRKRDAGAT